MIGRRSVARVGAVMKHAPQTSHQKRRRNLQNLFVLTRMMQPFAALIQDRMPSRFGDHFSEVITKLTEMSRQVGYNQEQALRAQLMQQEPVDLFGSSVADLEEVPPLRLIGQILRLAAARERIENLFKYHEVLPVNLIVQVLGLTPKLNDKDIRDNTWLVERVEAWCKYHRAYIQTLIDAEQEEKAEAERQKKRRERAAAKAKAEAEAKAAKGKAPQGYDPFESVAGTAEPDMNTPSDASAESPQPEPKADPQADDEDDEDDDLSQDVFDALYDPQPAPANPTMGSGSVVNVGGWNGLVFQDENGEEKIKTNPLETWRLNTEAVAEIFDKFKGKFGE